MIWWPTTYFEYTNCYFLLNGVKIRLIVSNDSTDSKI